MRQSSRSSSVSLCGLYSFLFLLCTSLCTCSSGGGGGPLNPVPFLVSAVYLGAGASPVTGDKLQLFLSESVILVPGATLDDSDFQLSDGTLGMMTVAPTQPDSRVVEITLGSGVFLTPGTTTIQFSSSNDAVTDLAGVRAQPQAARVITDGDGNAPSISDITLNNIVSQLNGTGPASGTLQVSENGFTVDLTYSDPGGIDTSATVIVASVTVSVNGAGLAAGHNLRGFLDAAAGATAGSYTVPAAVVFPQGAVTITTYVVDSTGRISSPVSFNFLVKTMTNELRLFETTVNASQVWFLDTSRDVEQYSVNLANAVTPVVVTSAANSRADLVDLLYILGLHHSTQSVNDAVMAKYKADMMSFLQGLLPGVNVTFTFSSPGAFPLSQPSFPYSQVGFSQICIAGSQDTSGATGVLGLAIFDEHNAYQDNDCLTDFQGFSRLGVFLHALINDGFLSAPGSLFRVTYDQFVPSRGGTAIGDPAGDGKDAQRLAGTQVDGRKTDIDLAIERLAKFTAVVVAHECGHSMGLVKNDAMPGGLYGGDVVNFPGSSAGHLAMPGSIFTGNSLNLMTPALSFVGTLDADTRFNTLNLAYLREVAVYN